MNYNLILRKTIMRTFFFLLIIALTIPFVYAENAYGQILKENNISYSTKRTDITEVFDNLSRQTGFHFFYDESVIEDLNAVSINVKNGSIQTILNELTKQTGLQFKIIDNTISVSRRQAVSTVTGNVRQENKQITGIIIDKQGESIIGANVIEKGTTNGVITDIDGKFSLAVQENAIIQISYIGYISQELVTGSSKDFRITLLEDTKTLEEVVVVAYGTQIKRNITGSMETVSFNELSDIPVAQFTQKMQGQIAGVQITQGTGLPGQGMNVRIRGSASLSTSSAPLYVVDGFPIVGDVNNINPSEIESMTILKDAAATSLYGSRAAFGVVLITTKGAKAGETRVNVNAYMGIQTIPEKGRSDMMDGTEWAQFKKEYYEDLGQAVPEAFQNPSQYGKGTDWYDAMLRTAMIQDYSISINAGKDKFTSSVVIGFFKQDGVVLNSDYNRASIRANSVYQISPQLKASFNVAPTFSFENRPSTDGAFFSGGGLLANAELTPPILSYKNEDGSMPVTITTPGITSFETPNWIRSAKEIVNKRKNNRLLSNASLEYEPIKNLKLSTSINIDLGQTFHNYFQPSTAGRAFAAAPSQINANLLDANNRYYSWLSENMISYAHQIGDHEFDILAGYTAQKFRSDYSAISGYNFTDDRVQTIDAALVKNNPTMDIQQWSMISYLTRVNYSYKGRYLIGASVRRDGSSRFGPNNRWGNFPSFSAGWIASDETFMENLEWLSLLKIRGSYGIIGNNNIGNYTHYNTVSSNTNVVFGNTISSGSAVTNLGNDDLGWEKTSQLDIGADISFLNNRINFTYDYYRKITSDLLYSLPVPRESGFSSLMGNIGKLKFWGHEFSINSRNLVGAFKWNTNFNISFSDNRVLELSGLSNELYAYSGFVTTISKVGGRIGQFYGLIQDGVYVNQQDYDNSPKAVDSQVGTIKFRDINNDNEISFGDVDGDKTEIGNPFPKFVFGFTNNFSYKNFDLSIVTSGSYGNKIATPSEQGTANLDGPFNVLKEVKDRWRSPENPGAGLYGKTISGTSRERDVFHTRFVKDGSHITIKNITLGYTFPDNLIKNINNLRIYASIQQPFVFTKYKYANPEVGVDFDGNTPSALLQGIDYSTYPVPRTFTVGLNVTL